MAYKRKIKNYGIRICPICGKQFTALHHTQITCCLTCKREWQFKSRKKYMTIYRWPDLDWLNCKYEEALERIAELEEKIRLAKLAGL